MSLQTAQSIRYIVRENKHLPPCQQVKELLVFFVVTGIVAAASFPAVLACWMIGADIYLSLYLTISTIIAAVLSCFFKARIDEIINGRLTDQEYYWLVNELVESGMQLDVAEKNALKADWRVLLMLMERHVESLRPDKGFIYDVMSNGTTKSYL